MKKAALLATGMCLFGAMNAAPDAHAYSEKYLGEVITVGFNFCPRGTMPANGQLLPIASYTALFSLYGTMYGGDGRSTFALPDLRGRMIVSDGQGPGLPPHRMGQMGGGAEQGGSNQTPGYVTMKYCVVSQGIFPSRN